MLTILSISRVCIKKHPLTVDLAIFPWISGIFCFKYFKIISFAAFWFSNVRLTCESKLYSIVNFFFFIFSHHSFACVTFNLTSFNFNSIFYLIFGNIYFSLKLKLPCPYILGLSLENSTSIDYIMDIIHRYNHVYISLDFFIFKEFISFLFTLITNLLTFISSLSAIYNLFLP